MKIVKYINKKIDKLYCFIARLRLKDLEFTIISNDCWGGGVYEDLHLPYTTPTVGLFFYAPCYIEFLNCFDKLIEMDLCFVKLSKYPEANNYRLNNKLYYPIGKLEDIEIHFLHYHSEKEATEKWNRRRNRINNNKLYFKFSDRDLCTDKLAEQFDKLPLKNKVFFSSNKKSNIQSLVFLNKYSGKDFIGDIYSDRWAYRKDFDVVKWLNKGQNKCL